MGTILRKGGDPCKITESASKTISSKGKPRKAEEKPRTGSGGAYKALKGLIRPLRTL